MLTASSTCEAIGGTTTCDIYYNFPVGDILFGIAFIIFLLSFGPLSFMFNNFKKI